MFEVRIFTTPQGKQPYKDWFLALKDRTIQARIAKRIQRLEEGNLGDTKTLGNELFELRFFFGSGYRVYFGREGLRLVLLLCGGDKSTQSRDIESAHAYWKQYLQHGNKNDDALH